MQNEKKYPFKYLDAYELGDKDFYFGRDEEVKQLYDMTFQSDLLLVYGASGTGKTSLIQCGLANCFKTHNWLALSIRRSTNINYSLEKTLDDAIGSDIEYFSKKRKTENEVDHSPLAQKIKALRLKYFKPIYLIFDQFEELYILGNEAEQKEFYQTVKQLLALRQPVKIIITIREEYLGYLHDFEKIIPDVLRKKLRVEPMTWDRIHQVLQGINNPAKSLVTLQKGKEKELIQAIFDKLHEGKISIELPYLQVLLEKLYLSLTNNDEQHQTEAILTCEALEKTGNIGDILYSLLDGLVSLLNSDKNIAPETSWKTLSCFVTVEGTKEPLSANDLQKQIFEINQNTLIEILQFFVSKRILRYDENEQVYEIAHDALAKQIHANRSIEEVAQLQIKKLIQDTVYKSANLREHFTAKQLREIDLYIDQLELLSEEKNWIEQSRIEVEKVEEQKQRTLQELELRNNELIETSKELKLQTENALRMYDEINLQKKVLQYSKRKTIVAFIVTLILLFFMVILWIETNKANAKANKLIEASCFHNGEPIRGNILATDNRLLATSMPNNVRRLPNGNLAARTIGYITEDTHGNFPGLEGAFDIWLRDCGEVVSTIDIDIQDVAETCLRKRLEYHDAHHGTAVVMEVVTGEIKAIVNLGKDEFGNYREMYNYAIGETIEPGTTFKLMSYMAMLEDDKLQFTASVNNGYSVTRYYYNRIDDNNRHETKEWLSVEEAFAFSSDIITKFIDQHYKGKEKQFIDRLYGMNLNQKLGLELPGEGEPEIKYPGSVYWSGLSLTQMSLGYEVRLAPIQVLTFYNAVANDGKMVKPRFVKKLIRHGTTEHSFDVQIIKSPIASAATINKAKRMMEAVVEYGTAKDIKTDMYKIAGKTGTAQVANEKYGYRGVRKNYASFVGYFPADQPRYSCIVSIYDPTINGTDGSVVSAPVFREIADIIYNNNYQK